VGRILKDEIGRPAGPASNQNRVAHQPQSRKALGVTVPLTLLGRADEVIDAPPHLCRMGNSNWMLLSLTREAAFWRTVL